MKKLLFILIIFLCACSPFRLCETKYSEKEVRMAYKKGIFDMYHFNQDSTNHTPAKYYFPLREDSVIIWINNKKHH